MYKKLILYRNELKNKSVPKYKIIGIVSELLLSKQIFALNHDIVEFLKDVFSLEFKEYVFHSRTLVVARVTREILSIENDSIYKNKLYKFIQEKIECLSAENKEERNQFDGWL
nr:MAG TPA: hypothetical protein [Caudoviricetes sp.]